MQFLRNASMLARFVLAWFVLSIGVAVASPVVKPANMELVCSGGGVMKLLVKGDNGGTSGTHTLDCPMCMSMDAPPPVPRMAAVVVPPLAHVLAPIYAARIAALTAAPLPARGPPAS